MTGLIKNRTIETFRPPLLSVAHLRWCNIENAACSVMYGENQRCMCVQIHVYAYYCLNFCPYEDIM